jgi:hypothetical protein
VNVIRRLWDTVVVLLGLAIIAVLGTSYVEYTWHHWNDPTGWFIIEKVCDADGPGPNDGSCGFPARFGPFLDRPTCMHRRAVLELRDPSGDYTCAVRKLDEPIVKTD